MFNLKHWLNLAANPPEYIWIEALLIKETPKAILIEFDGKKAWFPKACILRIKRNNANAGIIKIKISAYNWGNRYHLYF